ncbi:MAG: adenylate/guanylate cyclase domain-containing protein [Acidimicrobiia bacterium]|nr:adenylate/guanylate cyclase domain-containing protein [Acidimicrobiia bacterium]MDH5504726.1 adenylate/guanylate cyclase domain-containing protein [Acidimicrobiia bacterium]
MWLVHMALAPAFVAVLLAAPATDATWQHNPTHFWMVAGVAFGNLTLALRIGREAETRNDARLFLMSLSYSVSAAFFGVHALATPKLLAAGSNLGFSLAMPAGLFVAAILAALSSVEWSETRSADIVRSRSALTLVVLGIAAAWLYLSVNDMAPLGVPLEASGLGNLFLPLEIVGVALFLVAAFRYYLVYRSRPSPVAMALVTSMVLLAEVVAIVGLSRPWQLSWWTWHVIILVSYAYVAYAAWIQLRSEGRPTSLFSSVALAATVEEMRSEFRQALEQLVAAVEGSGSTDDAKGAARALGEQFGLTLDQTDILEGAADALASERRQSGVLAAMADISRQPLDNLTEAQLGLRGAEALSSATGSHFTFTAEDRSASDEGVPVVFHDRRFGTLTETSESHDKSDDDLIGSFADHLAMAMGNLAIYRDLRGLFGRYVSPAVATRLLNDPETTQLGGAIVETTVLFADLRGFTSYTESIQHPADVVDLLNRYFTAVVPILLDEGGTVDKFVGDAVMAIFNTPVLQPDHAVRAVRAAFRMQHAIAEVIQDRPDWPRFRIGVNTGSTLVGNIGSDELRNYTAIGDAVNVAARLETAAEPGQILMGATTYDLVRHVVTAELVEPVEAKGKAEPVVAYRLTALREPV